MPSMSVESSNWNSLRPGVKRSSSGMIPKLERIKLNDWLPIAVPYSVPYRYGTGRKYDAVLPNTSAKGLKTYR